MEDIKNRSFILSIDTQDLPTLNVWNRLLEMSREDQTGLVQKWAHLLDSDSTSLTKFKTSMNIHGSNDLLIKTYDLLKIDLPDPIRVKRLLVQLLWDMYKIHWKGWTDSQKINFRAAESIVRCMNRDISCQEVENVEIRSLNDKSI